MPPVPAPDATLDFLARLDDPSKWVVRRGVPVFVPHARRTKDGREIKVADADLPAIAAAVRSLRSEKGVVPAVGPGHRKADPNVREEDQPPVWGYAVNPRPGVWGEHARPCILVDEYLKPECADDAGQYAHRSVEYYPELREFRWVALLKREPFLDMGMVAYRDTPGSLHYSTEPIMADAPSSTNVDLPGGGKDKPAEPEGLAPDDEKKADAFMAHYQRKHKWVGYAMKCYEMDPDRDAAAKPDGKPAKPEEGDMESLQSNREFLAYQKATNDRLAALEAENKALRSERDRTACKEQLRTACVRYQYDADTEADRMLPLDAEGRKKHLAYIKATHALKPEAKVEGERLIDTGLSYGSETDAPPEFGPAEMAAALAYQDQHKCPYPVAVEAVEKGLHKRQTQAA